MVVYCVNLAPSQCQRITTLEVVQLAASIINYVRIIFTLLLKDMHLQMALIFNLYFNRTFTNKGVNCLIDLDNDLPEDMNLL